MLYGGAAMLTLVPVVVALLLRVLQDRRRRLWLWLVAEVPVVAGQPSSALASSYF